MNDVETPVIVTEVNEFEKPKDEPTPVHRFVIWRFSAAAVSPR